MIDLMTICFSIYFSLTHKPRALQAYTSKREWGREKKEKEQCRGGDMKREGINAIREVTQVEVTQHLLLYGSEHLDLDTNCAIVNAVHCFMKSTERL